VRWSKLLAACLIMAAGSMVQGTVGFGAGLFAVPILLLIDPAFVPGPVLVAVLVLTSLMISREREALDPGVRWAIGGRVAGTLAAIAIFANLPQRGLTIAMGTAVLLSVALSVSGLHVRPTTGSLLGAGALSGLMGTLASMGGPPMALLYQRASGSRLRSTLSAFFLFGSIISLIALAMARHFGSVELVASLALAPGALAGFLLSRWALPLLDRGYTRASILTLSAVSAMVVILRELL
jgi:uncharacterized membrane protein YfcA